MLAISLRFGYRKSVSADSVTIYTLISAVCGGGAVKLIDHLFGVRKTNSDITLAQRKQDSDEDVAMRNELRAEAERHRAAHDRVLADLVRIEDRLRGLVEKADTEYDELRVFVKSVEEERDDWREKFISIERKLTAAQLQIRADQSEIERYRDQVEHLQQQNDTLTVRIRAVAKKD